MADPFESDKPDRPRAPTGRHMPGSGGPISSTQNPRVKAALALRDRRERDRTGLTLVEGYDELLLALESGARLTEVLFCPAFFLHPTQVALLHRIGAPAVRALEVERRVFERLAYREHPDGWLGILQVPPHGLERLTLPANPLILVAEALEKPGNLGAILRTADAAGVSALIASDPLTDWGNPNLIRASKGTVFSVPIAEASTAATLAWLRQHGVQMVAAAPDAPALYHQVDLRGPTAIVVGAEKQGLSDAWLEGADLAVRVPMQGRANSLNVATVAALLIYEAVRQRT